METTVAEEKKFNPRLTKDIETFVQIMENLNLPRPKMIGEKNKHNFRVKSIFFFFISIYCHTINHFHIVDIAVPANEACGLHDIPDE